MKTTFYALFIMCLLISCSSSDDETSYYTQKQEAALAIMNGTFEDITFGLENEDHFRITFGTQYSSPVDINKPGGDILIKAQGECVWHNRGVVGNGEDIACYYEVSADAIYLSLIYKGGTYDKQVFERLEIKSISADKFILKDKVLTLPYTFVKKK